MAKIGIDSRSPMARAAITFNAKFGSSTVPAKREFRLPVGVENAPIRADAAFARLPRLVEGLDDRIVDAHGIGAGDEIAHDFGLRDRARHRVLAVQSGARPAELGDHDALARIGFAQPLIDLDGVIDGGRPGRPSQ